jgi:MFS transporter, FSR family, fosmidomycin resistance protein
MAIEPTTGESAVAAPAPAPVPAGAPPDRAGLSLLGTGHFLVDMTFGALSPLLPAFKDALALSDLETSLILASITFSSSLIQPLLGLMADRKRVTWFLWGGVALATIGITLAGLVDSFGLLLALILLAGVGGGAYHPEAARVANQLAGARKATGVAWFTVGGNLGFAAGPLLVALFVPLLDQHTSVLFAVPGAIACALLLIFRDRVAVPVIPRAARSERRVRSNRRGMGLLVAVVSLRTWLQFGLMVVVPLMLTEERGLSNREAGFVIFAFVMFGALGTIAGSIVADRIGGKRMFIASMPIAAPMIACFILVDGPLGIAMFAVSGAVQMASFSATVVMGQDYMPARPALAAALVLGFAAIGSATPWLPFIGWIADTQGRETAMWVLAALPLAAAALATTLPAARRPRPVAVPAVS